MKAKTANSKQLNILGNGSRPSDQEILTATLKRWRQRLGYCSVFAAVPALLASHVPVAHSDEAKRPEPSVAGQGARLEKLNAGCSTPALLKRQSEFLLPHQKGSFNMLATLGGNDDCPGRAIPEGNYTASAPYIDSGNTTGANNTVDRLYSYYYYSYDALGPDHIYSFTLSRRGSNPQIQVSTSSNTYRPLIYVLTLHGGSAVTCPTGTENFASNWVALSYSSADGTATLNSSVMNFLPLNVPLHLLVDSERNDASGSGPYTVRIQDVTIASAACPNPFNCAQYFVRQHYLDFLSREPDPDGLNFWTNEITLCGLDAQCAEDKRIHVSAAFFLSIEFQESGYLVYRTYKAAYGDLPQAPVPLTRQEFLPDTQRVGKDVVVGKSGWEQQLENNKNAFASEFVARSRFTTAFPPGMTAEQFVDALNTNAGGALSQAERNQLVSELAAGVKTRAQVLRAVAEDADFARSEFNKAFVLMQYFGYLLRNPNDAPDADFSGYNFWLSKLNQFNGDFVAAEMVKAFINSSEYRGRFGPT